MMNRIIFLVLAVSLAAPAFAAVAVPMTPPFAPTGNGGLVITNTSNGVMLSNATTIYLYTFTLDKSRFNFYLSYIYPDAAGFSVNSSVYSLYMNGTAVLVRNASGYSFYAKLLNTSYYSKPQSASILVYSVSNPAATATSSSTSSTATASTVQTTMSTTAGPTTTIRQGITEAEAVDYGTAIAILIVIAAIVYIASRKGKRQGKTQGPGLGTAATV